MRRFSAAVILFHHAIAERLGLGPTDLQCLDLLRESESKRTAEGVVRVRGMSGSELAALTGLTTGAITGVAARLERAGYLRREADPHDRRKQVLYPAHERISAIHQAFGPIQQDMAEFMKGFEKREAAAIHKFLAGGAELVYRHAAVLRAQAVGVPGGERASGPLHGKVK
jgi:DNA-binding MarR family transcriptional regulator